jgi:hypothetical protein
MSLRTYLANCGAAAFGIVVTIFCMFLSVLVVPYAFLDDYPLLSTAVGLGPSPWFGKTVLDAYAVNGRPLAGLLVSSLFSAAGTIDDLRFVRLFAVAGIVALALILHWALVRSGIGSILAAFVAVLVCSMPAFQVYSSWAVLCAVPYAAVLGGSASLLAVSAVDRPHLLVDRMVGATAALIAGLLIYQPAAMIFWVFLAVALAGAAEKPSRALRLVYAHLGVAVVALAVGYLVVKLGVHFIGSTAPNTARNNLTHDVVGKARWFFEQALYQSLNLFDLTPSAWLAAVVATVATVGLLLLIWRRAARPLLYVAIAVVLVPLSYLPSLATGENVAWYRTQPAITSLIALYACLGAVGIWLTARDWLRRRVTDRTLVAGERIALATAAVFVLASVVVATKNVIVLFVRPQRTELRLIRGQVAALPTGVPRVAFVLTDPHEGMTSLLRHDEFGFPSTAAPWTLEPAVLLVLREEGRLTNGWRPIVDRVPWHATTLPTNEPVVDVRSLRKLR